MKRIRQIISFGLQLAILMSLLLGSTMADAVAAKAESVKVERVGEIESLRETNSETYLLSDGSYECVVYAYDKYYRHASGSLQLIDNTIKLEEVKSQQVGRRYKNAANAFDVFFQDGTTPTVTIQKEGLSIGFSALPSSGGNSSRLSASSCVAEIGVIESHAALGGLTQTGDNTVTYADAFFNADLVYVLDNWALKEYIILKNREAANEYSFLLTTNGLTLRTTEDGAYFTDESGKQRFAFDSLFAVDANGVMTEALSYSFVPVKDTADVLVTVTLDNNYLQAAERAFPVVIDPTIMISSSDTADACVCSGYIDTNYQMATQLRTGYDSDYGIRRTYIKFNIPASIPAYSVTDATLDLEKVSGAVPQTRAYRCTASWSSGSITWRNSPGYSTTNMSTVSVPFREGSVWYTMNVTGLVQDWVNGTYANYGFVVRDQNESDPNHWTTFYSSDAGSPHKPELHITYNESGGSPPEPTDPPDPPEPEPELPSVNLMTLYDEAYADMYANAASRIYAQSEVVKQFFYDEFQINVNIVTPASYSSYADIKGPNDPDEDCINSDLVENENDDEDNPDDDYVVVAQEHHYTNIYNNLYRITPASNRSTVKMLYIGHDICFNDPRFWHIHNSSGTNAILGLSCVYRRVMTITDIRSSEQEIITAIHELGHMFMAPDHDNRQADPSQGEDNYCIYGLYKEQIQRVQDIVICDGCRNKILENINRFSS